jgi:hypothetical protein
MLAEENEGVSDNSEPNTGDSGGEIRREDIATAPIKTLGADQATSWAGGLIARSGCAAVLLVR